MRSTSAVPTHFVRDFFPRAPFLAKIDNPAFPLRQAIPELHQQLAIRDNLAWTGFLGSEFVFQTARGLLPPDIAAAGPVPFGLLDQLVACHGFQQAN
jgi:hypothetical protein